MTKPKLFLAYLDPPPEKYLNGIRISNSEIVWNCELSFGDVGDGHWKQNVLMNVWDVGDRCGYCCQ